MASILGEFITLSKSKISFSGSGGKGCKIIYLLIKFPLKRVFEKKIYYENFILISYLAGQGFES